MEVSCLKSKLLVSNHGFSTRNGGVSHGPFASLNLGMNRGDDDESVVENWKIFLKAAEIDSQKLVYGKQVHGNKVHVATKADLKNPCYDGDLLEMDGYVTNEKNLPLVIFVADCIPVLLEDSSAGVIGAIHCGWRPTVADIVKNALEQMEELGARPDNICAVLGPAIEKCCFEVGPEVIEAVEELLGNPVEGLYLKKDNGKYMLDLKGVVKCRLLQLGIKEENIEYVGECTLCHPDKYFSHRYKGSVRGSLAAVISM